MRSNFALKTRSPGTEFLDAETGRQKSPLKRANAHRDKNSGIEWPEIPAETPYLKSYRKRAVCGDWMVGATGIEPVTPSMSTSGNVRFAETGWWAHQGSNLGPAD